MHLSVETLGNEGINPSQLGSGSMKRVGTKEAEITITVLVEFLLRNAWLFFTFFACASGYTVWKFRENPAYTAVSTIMLETSQSNAVQAVAEKLTGGQALGAIDPHTIVDKYLMLMGSRNFADSAARILIQNRK